MKHEAQISKLRVIPHVLRRRAYAKINLGLRVLNKRPDGYHEITTTFAEIGLFDELTFTPRNDGRVTLQCRLQKAKGKRQKVEDCIRNSDNLVYCAAKLLHRFAPKGAGVSISLTKNIPLGAGLGGGSSDAATTLKVLNQLWRLHLTLDELEWLGEELGSDAPFFIRGGIQIGRGRGEILHPTKLPKNFPRYVVLVYPRIKIETASAYEWINAKLKMKNEKCETADSKLSVSVLKNDFEKVVFARYPELATIKRALKKCGASTAAMSGSGSTIFGLFARRPAAVTVQLLAAYGRVVVTRIREK